MNHFMVTKIIYSNYHPCFSLTMTMVVKKSHIMLKPIVYKWVLL